MRFFEVVELSCLVALFDFSDHLVYCFVGTLLSTGPSINGAAELKDKPLPKPAGALAIVCHQVLF